MAGPHKSYQSQSTEIQLLNTVKVVMLAVLVLLFSRMSQAIVKFLSMDPISREMLIYLLSFFIVLLVTVATIASIIYVHGEGEIGVRYHKWYLPLDLLGIILPINIAAECLYRVATTRGHSGLDNPLFRYSMAFLFLMFIALLVRGLIVLSQFPPSVEQAPYRFVSAFHIVAICVTLIGWTSPKQAYWGVGFALLLIFMFFCIMISRWILGVQFKDQGTDA